MFDRHVERTRQAAVTLDHALDDRLHVDRLPHHLPALAQRRDGREVGETRDEPMRFADAVTKLIARGTGEIAAGPKLGEPVLERRERLRDVFGRVRDVTAQGFLAVVRVDGAAADVRRGFVEDERQRADLVFAADRRHRLVVGARRFAGGVRETADARDGRVSGQHGDRKTRGEDAQEQRQALESRIRQRLVAEQQHRTRTSNPTRAPRDLQARTRRRRIRRHRHAQRRIDPELAAKLIGEPRRGRARAEIVVVERKELERQLGRTRTRQLNVGIRLLAICQTRPAGSGAGDEPARILLTALAIDFRQERRGDALEHLRGLDLTQPLDRPEHQQRYRQRDDEAGDEESDAKRHLREYGGRDVTVSQRS